MSTSYHLQTDGVTERANCSIGQIFWSTIRPDQLNWYEKVPMCEFAINTSINDSTGFALFELNQGFMPAMITQVKSDADTPPGIKVFAQQALQNIAAAHDSLIASRVFQRHYVNTHRHEEPKIDKGDLVYLLMKNLSLLKGRIGKLLSRFIGPYCVVQTKPETSSYELELPEQLVKCRIYPMFHVNLLRPHQPNNDILFPNRTSSDAYDFGAPEELEWLVDEIIGHHWEG
jgi:hypothetical protein